MRADIMSYSGYIINHLLDNMHKTIRVSTIICRHLTNIIYWKKDHLTSLCQNISLLSTLLINQNNRSKFDRRSNFDNETLFTKRNEHTVITSKDIGKVRRELEKTK